MMSGKKKQYHHGNLSSDLVTQAIKLLEQEGISALSLRRVAKEAGVSQAAPYSHFKDKQALLTSVANEGYSRFGKRMLLEAQSGKEEDYLIGLGRGYIFFAMENPGLFHLMFGGELSKLIDVNAINDEYGSSYQMLVDAIDKHPLDRFSKQPKPLLDVAFSWSLVHGIANLLQAERFTPEKYGYKDVEPFVDDLLRRYLGSAE
ncbi:MAG: AcrR family transcriptional regulator [Oceanicoccus sp.]|jgi:AcrR family transcriptional regulator